MNNLTDGMHTAVGPASTKDFYGVICNVGERILNRFLYSWAVSALLRLPTLVVVTVIFQT